MGMRVYVFIKPFFDFFLPYGRLIDDLLIAGGASASSALRDFRVRNSRMGTVMEAANNPSASIISQLRLSCCSRLSNLLVSLDC
jgi:hypothetical protein